MSFASKIYNYMPVFMQNIMVSIYGWRWKKRRFGGIFSTELNGYKERELYTTAQWNEYITKQLRSLLLHAYSKVPYYREQWEKVGIAPNVIMTITPDTINKLPFLSKDNLRQFCKSTLLINGIKNENNYFESSGSTGTPVSIFFSTSMHQKWSAAYEARVRNWAGVDRSMSRGMVGGRRVVPQAVATPPYYRYNSIENQVYFSAYHISVNTANDYLKGIEKYNPAYMVGYAMSNYLLARFILQEGLEAPKLKAVITSSEKLTKEMREVFRKVYGCKTYDGWSGVEACGLVSECEHGNLHISPDVGLIELLDENGNPVQPGETGEVVCTGFLNYEQPLIRYKIGDYMTLAKSQDCQCGRQMPVIEDIAGRTEDVVVGKDGRQMVRFHGIYTGLSKIIMGQVVQEDLDTITLNIVADSALTDEDKEILTKRIYSQLGAVNVQIFQVKEIPCGVNGKYKAVVSKVKRGHL